MAIRPTPRDLEAHKQMVLDTYSKTETPILIGPVTLLRGWRCPLAETETLLEDMVAEKKLRHVTSEEKRRFDVQVGYFPV